MTSVSNELAPIPNRVLKSRPGKHLFASAGNRLWADYLDPVPGFQGRLDFIHKQNIPLLFKVLPDSEPLDGRLDVEWHVTHSRMNGAYGNSLFLDEVKYITEDDVAVSIQRWCNDGSTERLLRFEYDSSWVEPENFNGTTFRGVRYSDTLGRELRLVGTANFSIEKRSTSVLPGETVVLVMATALGLKGIDSFETLRERAFRRANGANEGGPSRRTQPESVVTDHPQFLVHREQALSWYKQAPKFSSSSELINAVWQYRWFILKHNHATPGIGYLKNSVFYEGRSHKLAKTPWVREGWEFSKLIPLSTPFHILDARWHKSIDIHADILGNLGDVSERKSGIKSAAINEKYAVYSHFIGWAVWKYHELTGKAITDRLMKNLEATVRTEYELALAEGDVFVPQYNHRLTGKEYQPSYWYFSEFPKVPREDDTYTPVKRVDRAVYQFLNVLGLYNLMVAHEHHGSEEIKGILDAYGAAINARMWDSDSEFFYDLHPQTDEKALVKNIVGFYPWWAGVAENVDPASILRHLGPSEFGTPFGPPSTSRDCAAYAPGGGWYGNYIKGARGCVWNGPNWPYATGIVTDMLGALARSSESARSRFTKMLHNYLLCHFDGHDLSRPYLVEHYNAETGEPISDEPDYNHSFLIDILIRHVAGISVNSTGLVIDPIDIGLEHYELTDLNTRHGVVSVHYIKGSELKIYLDGTLLYIGVPKRVIINI